MSGGGGIVCHVLPPSIVRTIVPLLPLAHTTVSLTALMPRNRAVTPLLCSVHRGPPEAETDTVAIAIARASAPARRNDASSGGSTHQYQSCDVGTAARTTVMVPFIVRQWPGNVQTNG